VAGHVGRGGRGGGAGSTDAGTYDLVSALTNSGDSTIDGDLSVGGAATVTGNATVGGTLGVTGDISAAGGFRQCIQFGYANVAAGDVIDIRIRAGSGWTATTADIGVALEVEC
jgi:hypothetical protein